MDDENHLIKNLQQKDRLVRKTWDKKWKIHIKFSVFKSKILEWVWRVLVWEKKYELYATKGYQMKKNQTYKLTKTLRSIMKGRYGRRLRQKTSWKSSGRLHGSRMEVFLPRSLPNLKNLHIQIQIWKTCFSKNVQMA